MNPTSYSAHAWLARARLREGAPGEAVDAARQTIRIAPADPNTHALAGEIALATGAWRRARLYFQDAVARGPAAHLWFHAGLLDAAAAAGDPAEVAHVYARAASVFTDERVLGSEARCLAPGDRYLLARMTRVFADLSRRHGVAAEHEAAEARAGVLAQPDPRGICAGGGRAGQTSPETAVASYWRSVSDGGWAAGQAYLLPEAGRVGRPTWESGQFGSVRRLRLAWIHSLNGGARRATVVHQVERDDGSASVGWCARVVARFTRAGWFLEGIPRLDRIPCRP